MSDKQSLYLKYRPSQLNELVGQKHVVATLKQASINNEFAHAYLFSGNHGCGKTSSARILASLLTCENVKDGMVCGKCKACKTIHSGASLDVKELDGATSRGIDDIKMLIDGAQWSPQELKRKVYLIDECHQLTKEATSALLKILEEPPSYLVFILCTTEIKKMLPTILSRCQRFNFGKISTKDIASRLRYIADEEKINIEEDAIYRIAQLSRGGMRDAVGYLEQIGTVASDKLINKTHIQKYFGVSGRDGILNIVKSIIDGNIPMVLDQVNDMIMASVDVKQIMFEISDIFRDIMILKAYKGDTKQIDLPDTEIAELNKIGDLIKLSHLLKLAHLFSDVERKMGFNINDRWIMEATLINCIAVLRK